MKAFPRLVGALIGALFTAHCGALAASPEVEEIIAGPTDAGGIYVISPDGGHVAYMGMKGTRFVVTVDGVEGPVFDELYGATGQSFYFPEKTAVMRSTPGGQNADPMSAVIFSADGAHWAYAGRQKAEYVVIHDGKEVARGPREMLSLNYGFLTLSPGGRHVHFMEMDRSGSRAKWRLNMSGVPGPWSSNNNGIKPVFSADDTRYAYNAASEDDTGRQVLVVDGKVAGYLGYDPVFTADGKSLLSVSRATTASPKPSVLVDGKPTFTALGIDRIVPAPVGRRWGAIVRTRLEGHTQIPEFVLDGKIVPGTEGAQQAWFSPDGKHHAVACQNSAARSMFMVVDGKQQNEYQGITTDEKYIRWTPDGSTFIYLVTAGGRSFLVANDEERPITSLIGYDPIAMPKKGARYAYATRDGSNRNFSLILDGESVLPAGMYPYDNSLNFSPDGSRFAYLVGPVGRSELTGLVIDGAVQPGLAPGYFGKWMSSSLTLPSTVFSHDGKHVAYIGRTSDMQRNGMFVDGKLVHPDAQTIFFPTFTPDNGHLFWVAQEPAQVRGQPPSTVVYVDGVEAVRANGLFFAQQAGTFTMNEHGVVTFLAENENSARIFRITPPDDTSVASLLERGTQVSVAAASAGAEATAANLTKPAVKTVTATKVTAVAAPGDVPVLTWNDLVRRPEARPVSCTVNRDFRFQGGAVVASGTEVNIMEVNPGELVVGTKDGRLNFGLKPDETNILEVANASWAQLQPAQRDLNYTTLLQRTDLWPYRLKLLLPYELDGRKTRVGDTALLLGLEGRQLLVRHESTGLAFTVEPQETDLMDQARAIVVSDAGASGRLLEEFAGALVSPISGRPVTLDPEARPKLVVIYMGAGWCGPCQQFAPQLVKILNDKAPKGDDVTMLFLSGDRSPAEAKAYATKLGIDWPTLYFKSRDQLPAFQSLFGDSIPQLIVTDRHGKTLIDSSKVGTARALQQLGGML